MDGTRRGTHPEPGRHARQFGPGTQLRAEGAFGREGYGEGCSADRRAHCGHGFSQVGSSRGSKLDTRGDAALMGFPSGAAKACGFLPLLHLPPYLRDKKRRGWGGSCRPPPRILPVQDLNCFSTYTAAVAEITAGLDYRRSAVCG